MAWTTFSTVYSIPESLNQTAASHQRPSLKSLFTEADPGGSGHPVSVELSATATTAPAATAGAGENGPSYAGLNTLLVQVAVVFLLNAAYFGMVLTDWATLENGNQSSTGGGTRQGETAMWLQATAQWIALGLYAWSLFAPAVFAEREFHR